MFIKNADGSTLEIPTSEKEPVVTPTATEKDEYVEVTPVIPESKFIPEEKVVDETKVGLESPWCRFYKILYNLFEKDDSVEITMEEGSPVKINIGCSNACKLEAIKKVVGSSRSFGNVKVDIIYLLADSDDEPIALEEFVEAFKDTGYLVDAKTAETPTGDKVSFPIMAKDVIQFYDDNISDYYGNATIVVADAVKEILDVKNFTPFFNISTAIK